MRLYHILPAALIGAAASAIVQPQITVALTTEQINAKAEQFTVRIIGIGLNRPASVIEIGSGVIVKYIEEEGTYYILTAKHVVRSALTYKVRTFDKKEYQIESDQIIKLPGVDLALLPLKTTEKYTPAELGIRQSDILRVGTRIYVSGFPATGIIGPGSLRPIFSGNIALIRPERVDDGYSLVHDAKAETGMSGGPLLNSEGRLIGIHGRTDVVIGEISRPGINLGIPIKTFVDLVPKTFFDRAIAKMKQENYQGAIADFSRALQFDPNYADAYIGRGYTYFAQKDYQRASQDATSALKINPQSAQAYRLRGVSRSQQEKYREAIQDFNSAIQIELQFADAYLRRGNAHRFLGNDTAAEEDLRRYQQLRFSTEDIYLSAVNKGYVDSRIENPPPPINWTLANNLTVGSKVYAVAFSPSDPNLVASGSGDGKIRLWDLKTGRVRRTLPGHGSEVRSIAFSRDGKRLASGDLRGNAKVWNVEKGTEIQAFGDPPREQISSIAFSQSGQTLTAGLSDGRIITWLVESRKTYRNFNGRHTGVVTTIVYSPNGQTIATAGADNTIKVWSVRSQDYGKLLNTFTGHTALINSITFSPDGQTLVSSSLDRSIKVWDFNTGKLRRSIDLGSGVTANELAISPDGQVLASGNNGIREYQIKLWNLLDGTGIGILSGHTGLVRSVAFSPDGRLVSGSEDNTVRIWQRR